MLPIERRQKILELIIEERSITSKELCKRLGVSLSTIRNDLKKMETSGELSRHYGGAIISEEITTDSVALTSRREIINAYAKDIIGKKAVEFVRDGEIIFLDASSTSIFLAKSIKKNNYKCLTVITNAMRVALELSDSNIKVICTGGNLRKNNLSYVGSTAEKVIAEQYFANKLFFSCIGISLLRGLFDPSEEEARVKRKMIEVSDKKILLCDSSKFDLMGIPQVVDFNDIDVLITEKWPGEKWAKELTQLGVELIVADDIP